MCFGLVFIGAADASQLPLGSLLDSAKCRLVLGNISSDAGPAERIANLVAAEVKVVSFILNRLRAFPFWEKVEGLEFHGSRVHRYWGSSYDLDVGLIGLDSDIWLDYRYHHDVESLRTEFFDQFGFRLDLSQTASAKLLIEQLSDRQKLDAIFKAAVKLNQAARNYIVDRQVWLKNLIGGISGLESEPPPPEGNPFYETEYVNAAFIRFAKRSGIADTRFITSAIPFLLKGTAENRKIGDKLKAKGFENIFYFDDLAF